MAFSPVVPKVVRRQLMNLLPLSESTPRRANGRTQGSSFKARCTASSPRPNTARDSVQVLVNVRHV